MFGPFVMPQAVNAKKADFTPHYKSKHFEKFLKHTKQYITTKLHVEDI